jgi:hypothetical protein
MKSLKKLIVSNLSLEEILRIQKHLPDVFSAGTFPIDEFDEIELEKLDVLEGDIEKRIGVFVSDEKGDLKNEGD